MTGLWKVLRVEGAQSEEGPWTVLLEVNNATRDGVIVGPDWWDFWSAQYRILRSTLDTGTGLGQAELGQK